MVIQHNLTALNTGRQLGLTTGIKSKSMEKLSSGYRINRSGDYSSGLAISEKMRKQIRGLNRASDNAAEGVSLIQTADGALEEVHTMLQRMRELSVQATNDTNAEKDRAALQDEIDQLIVEVDRVSRTTKFNTINLLDGTLGPGLKATAVCSPCCRKDKNAEFMRLAACNAMQGTLNIARY